ncbi:hypothetical protein AMELA_G00178380 [Ameiurus melas]|uniref:Uncharacterized protein n=1 Tax=Ameiurus melas TaxID=219545 RepID=A0A7J6ACF8_AMEME|nr:hypothetical protein AMELA_G00178380 [Ameiurus melas]
MAKLNPWTKKIFIFLNIIIAVSGIVVFSSGLYLQEKHKFAFLKTAAIGGLIRIALIISIPHLKMFEAEINSRYPIQISEDVHKILMDVLYCLIVLTCLADMMSLAMIKQIRGGVCG